MPARLKRILVPDPEGPDREPQELEALLRASRAAHQHLSLDAALDTILGSALALVAADEGSVQLLDPACATLAIAVARGLPPEAHRERVPLGRGISGTVAATGRALLLPSVVEVERIAGARAPRPIAAAVSVPLACDGEVIGVLNLNRTRPGPPLTERHLRLATLFAESAAQAIRNARFLQRAERYAAQMEALREAGLRLAASLDPQETAEATLREGLRLAASPQGFVSVYAADGSVDLATYMAFPRDLMRLALTDPAVAALAGEATPLLLSDPRADPALALLAPHLRGPAVALVPLPIGGAGGSRGGLLGVTLGRSPPSGLTGTLAAFAGEAGTALGKALLHRRLAGEQRELEAVLASVDMPVVLIDGDGRFRRINPAAALVFGIAAEFEIGRPAAGKLGPDLEALVAPEGSDPVEVVRTVGGQRRTFRARVTPVATPAGGGSLIVLADVSEQRDLARQKENFVAVIGHELRTPLTSIKGFASTLSRRGAQLPPESLEAAHRTILTQAERLERLIEDLLLAQRMGAGDPPLRLAWDDVSEICTTVAVEAAQHAPEREIRLEGTDGAVPLLTDRLKVEQVLAHLIDNALKFSEASAPVVVRLCDEAERVTIAVSDRGIGIFSRDIPRLFEPFDQLDASSTREHGGTGIGLSICKALVDALGGGIEVKTALGKGSTFTVSLPKQASPVQRRDLPEPREVPGVPERAERRPSR